MNKFERTELLLFLLYICDESLGKYAKFENFSTSCV